jgi:predicted negative regulator of RcsB-dependent stress response
MKTRHPTARRVHRQDASPDDAFVAGVLETSVWAKQHRRTLVIAAVVVAVAVIALVLVLNNRSTTRAAAAEELVRVRAVTMSGNMPLAIRDLEQFLTRYSGTPSAAEARLHLGRAYLETRQASQAIDVLRPLARDAGNDLGANAAFLTAAAHEMLQEPHRAEEVYLRVASDGRFLFQRQEAFDNAARIRLQRGDAAGAVQLYERALAITPQTHQDRQVLELRLGEARALAASPQGAQPQPPPEATPAEAPSVPAPQTPQPTPDPSGGEPPPGS